MRTLLPLFIFFLLLTPPATAKDKPAPSLPPLPGTLWASASGTQIFLESGRSLLWPERGPLLLRDAQKNTVQQISLQAVAQKTSGVEAMGLEVEEVDLGGQMSSKKKYLSGKKAPVGRRLAADSVGGAGLPGGQEEKKVVDGIPMTWMDYPNGSSLWKIQWPTREEELFFDRKKSLIYSQQRERKGPFTVLFKQFSDGSYQRHFQRDSGEVQVVRDAGDQSLRITVLNGKGETLAEFDCREKCE